MKRIVFAPIFLLFLSLSIYFFQPILNNYTNILFSDYTEFYGYIILSLFITFASISFCLYITFTQNIRYTIFLAIVSFALPFIFLKPNLALVLGFGLLTSLVVTFFMLQNVLKTYTNFSGANLLIGPIKTLNIFLVLTLSFAFFLNANSQIKTNGFKIPDKLMDWAIDLSMQNQNIPVKGERYLAQLPTLTKDQIDLLKQNPEILNQYGIDTKDIDQIKILTPTKNPNEVFPASSNNLKGFVKNQISGSLDQMIKPYLYLIPFILALLFYSIMSFCLWIISFFITPATWLIFYLFEKTGFIKFEKEMREVKKIVV